MASNNPTDPFAYLDQLRVDAKTRANIGAPDEEEEEIDPFSYLATPDVPVVRFAREEKDIGVGGAFKAGVGRGLIEPFTIITGAPEVDQRIDETGEKVGEFLGSMVGLGISFIPFSAGTGLAMKGVGLAAKLSPELFRFVKFTAAGAAQFAGTSETLEDVPKNAVAGLAFGGAIEGLFFARALRARRGQVNLNKLVDDGSPIPDMPINPEHLGNEIAVSPAAGKSVRQMEIELNGLAGGDLSMEEVLVSLADEVSPTVRLGGLSDPETVAKFAQTRLPNAQVLTRTTQGGKVGEVLVHNPVDPEDVLDPKRIAQWKASGTMEGMEVIYKGKTYELTGMPLKAKDRIQLRNPENKAHVFAPLRNEVTFPRTPRIFTERANRLATLRAATQAAREKIGFVIPSRGEGLGRRGFVNVSEFDEVPSISQWLKDNAEELSSIQADSPEEALALFARNKGIKGLVVRDSGIATEVRVFDQDAVSFIREPPRPVATEAQPGQAPTDFPTVGIVLDNATVTFDEATGKTLVHQFNPSWKNGIIPALRDQGVGEKEINSFLDMYYKRLTNESEKLMDPEFQRVLKASRAQYFEGCL